MSVETEINNTEKQFFANEIERLEPIVVPDVPDLVDEPDDRVLILEKSGTFRLNNAVFEIDTTEVLSYGNERISKGYQVTTNTVIAIEGLVLARNIDYYVAWHADPEPHWKAGYYSQDTQQLPGRKKPMIIPSDYEREAKAFYASHPSEEEVEARREDIALEMQQHESMHALGHRFTRTRFWEIMPLLQQLGIENFIRTNQG